MVKKKGPPKKKKKKKKKWRTLFSGEGGRRESEDNGLEADIGDG